MLTKVGTAFLCKRSEEDFIKFFSHIMENKKIDYKKRLKEGFEVIITMAEREKPNLFKRIKNIAKAQLKNLEGIENKQV